MFNFLKKLKWFSNCLVQVNKNEADSITFHVSSATLTNHAGIPEEQMLSFNVQNVKLQEVVHTVEVSGEHTIFELKSGNTVQVPSNKVYYNLSEKEID